MGALDPSRAEIWTSHVAFTITGIHYFKVYSNRNVLTLKWKLLTNDNIISCNDYSIFVI